MLEMLLDNGADVDQRQRSRGKASERYTPLMLAASRGLFAVVDLLCIRGADLTAQSRSGFTALHRWVGGVGADCVTRTSI